MDFANFTSPELAAVQAGQAAAAVGTYWTRSVVVVGVWSLILTGTLAPPVAAFVASFNHEPVWSDGAWTWPYTFTVLGVQRSARLEARLVSAGVSNITSTAGTWSLNLNPADPRAFLDIAWSRAASGDRYQLTYTNVISGTAEYGSYITHAVTGDPPYDAFYDLYGALGGNLTEIEWSRTTKAGRTRDPAHFQNSEWHCWGADLNSTTCP